MTEIITSLDKGKMSLLWITQLNAFNRVGGKWSNTYLYHLTAYPSAPGDLFIFSLNTATFSSFIVISDIIFKILFLWQDLMMLSMSQSANRYYF